MNELMRIELNHNQEPCVSGRDLHEFLEVGTPYHIWFPRMLEYGFTEDVDFCTEMFESTGGRPGTDHVVKLDMAKELSMIQRTDKGKLARQYFIAVEKEFNSPEKVMARALKFADATINQLSIDIKVKDQQIAELQPKATYYDLILQNKDLISMTAIAKDYGMSATQMNRTLHDLGVQYKQSSVWFLYQKHANKGYTSTKTHSYLKENGNIGTRVHTYWTQKGRLFLYDLLKDEGIIPLIER